MNKRFRCGRLILTKDGTIKKLGLEEGGGTRWCAWDNNDMDFNNVHYRLRDIFHLRKWKKGFSIVYYLLYYR
jgi:hypothetical protein